MRTTVDKPIGYLLSPPAGRAIGPPAQLASRHFFSSDFYVGLAGQMAVEGETIMAERLSFLV
jgi:hypothetical protein